MSVVGVLFFPKQQFAEPKNEGSLGVARISERIARVFIVVWFLLRSTVHSPYHLFGLGMHIWQPELLSAGEGQWWGHHNYFNPARIILIFVCAWETLTQVRGILDPSSSDADSRKATLFSTKGFTSSLGAFPLGREVQTFVLQNSDEISSAADLDL